MKTMSYEVELLKAWMDQGHRTEYDGTPIPPVMPDEWAAEMDPDGEAQAEFDAAPGPDDGRWYSWMPDIGHTEYDTPDEARADAEAQLEDCAGDSWPDDVGCTEWGRLVPYGRAEAYDHEETPSGPNDFTVSYRMRAIRPDPKIDAEPDGDRSEPPPGRRWCCNKEHSERYVSGYPVRPSLSEAWADHDAVLASVEPTPTGEPRDKVRAMLAEAKTWVWLGLSPDVDDETVLNRLAKRAGALVVANDSTERRGIERDEALGRVHDARLRIDELEAREVPDPLPEGARFPRADSSEVRLANDQGEECLAFLPLPGGGFRIWEKGIGTTSFPQGVAECIDASIKRYADLNRAVISRAKDGA